ncbi:hypothetical protein U1Q18_013006, partial [Sarracenia purpurea var. burkii]
HFDAEDGLVNFADVWYWLRAIFLQMVAHSHYADSGSRLILDPWSILGLVVFIWRTLKPLCNLPEEVPAEAMNFQIMNGKWLGTAKHFNAGSNGHGVVDSPIRKLQWESALFPHVLLKNVVVVLQFSVEDGLIPEEGYKPWASALEDGNAILGPTFSNPRDSEVMMMVGLPASGKSTWAEKWVKEHPEKQYVLLETNLALDQMKVLELMCKLNYGERFDRLMNRATGIFNTLLSRIAKTPRNYILDQTNVYKSARKRKLKPFADFQKIAVVVFLEPEELKVRADKRFKEMGKEVPIEAVNEMCTMKKKNYWTVTPLLRCGVWLSMRNALQQEVGQRQELGNRNMAKHQLGYAATRLSSGG